MICRELGDGYQLDDDRTRVDLDVVHAFLSTDSYWAQGRSFDVTATAITHSVRVVGLYAPDGSQAGFGRVVSDTQTFAWLGDVFVLPEHRGSGRGTALVRELIDGSDFPGVRWMLATLDAHGLYRKLGFDTPDDRIMERPKLT